MNWIKHFCWYVTHSYRFMQGSRDFYFWVKLFPLSAKLASASCRWDKMTPDQRQHWYLTTDRRL